MMLDLQASPSGFWFSVSVSVSASEFAYAFSRPVYVPAVSEESQLQPEKLSLVRSHPVTSQPSAI